MKFKVMTYGCKVNTYDSGLLQKRFQDSGFVEDSSDPDVVLMNTCAVTHEATKESLRHVRKIKRDHPKAKVVMTGCAAQVDSKLLLESEADLIVANSDKTESQNHVKSLLQGQAPAKRLIKSTIFKEEDLEPGGGVETSHTVSFVKIQDGCNSFCTFCVIPFARGKSRSLSIEALVGRINELSEQGVKEVVLTGVHIGDYEDPTASLKQQGLEGLVRSVLSSTDMPRIRLSSLEPIELSEELLGLYAENKRLCPHFHMSIQSANTKVLHQMKRKYSQEDVLQSFENISKYVPGAFVGMDVIVGFPGETEAEFEDTVAALERSYWSQIHVFPYSPRPGVYANKLDGQMHRSKIMERAKKLRALGQSRHTEFLKSQVGKTKQVLLLKKRGLVQSGLSEDYINISFEEQSIIDLCKNLQLRAKDYEGVHVNPHGQYATASTALILNLTNRAHYVSKERLKLKNWPY